MFNFLHDLEVSNVKDCMSCKGGLGCLYVILCSNMESDVVTIPIDPKTNVVNCNSL